MKRLKGVYLLGEAHRDWIYGPEERAAIAELIDITAPPQTPESFKQNPAVLQEADVIMSGWGMTRMDEEFLAAAPKLKAVFYGGSSIRYCTSDAFWDRDIVITSAYAANAVPVAEYTLSVTLLSLKQFWRLAAMTREGRGFDVSERTISGGYGSTVGLVSFGMIARKTLELLQRFDLKCLVYSSHLSEEEARKLNVERCSLAEIFERSDVVSLHTPDLPETRGMVTGEHFASMKPGAAFINTARGAVVREDEMIEVLRKRPDLTAILDVTWPEPTEADSPLRVLPNVILTPHIAGAMQQEARRLGRSAADELRRYLAGEPLQWQITRQQLAKLA